MNQNVGGTIDAYRDSELDDYLDRPKYSRNISFGPSEDDEERTYIMPEDIDRFFKEKAEREAECS